MAAIQRSLQICFWQDNLIEKWMPPQWMWHLDEELAEHFEWVKEQRRKDAPTDDDDDDDDEDAAPSKRRQHMSTMLENDFANGRA